MARRGFIVGLLGIALLLVAACQAQPLDNPQGTSAGLAATPSSDYTQARALIAALPTATAGSTSGYARSNFGSPWLDQVDVPLGHNGCDARDDILKRDMDDETFTADDPTCTVATGTLSDPYTGHTINFVRGTGMSNAVQIDHVVPLSYAWQMGANGWTYDQRKNFANDPLNLLAVDGPTNGGKGDSGPSQWQPPNSAIECSYAIRFAQVATKYALPVTVADRSTMVADCS